MFTYNFEKLGSRKLRRLPQIADFKARNTLRTRCDTAFVGIIVPSLWGGLGRGLTLLFFSGGHIGPHPTAITGTLTTTGTERADLYGLPLLFSLNIFGGFLRSADKTLAAYVYSSHNGNRQRISCIQ